MKGIIFTEFLEMVEKDYGFEVLNNIIDKSNLQSNGVYSGVGTYDHAEFNQLLEQLSKVTELSANDIFYQSGWDGFSEFNGLYSEGSGRWDSRNVNLSVSYNFGNQQVKSRKRRTGLEDEAGRVEN